MTQQLKKSRAKVRQLNCEWLEDRNLLATLHVSPMGNDGGSGAQDSPFKSIQRAVNVSASDDVIKVAGGTYTFDAALNPARDGVVSYLNKRLTFQGSFLTSDWSKQDFSNNPSIIDGQNQVRGVSVVGLGPVGATNFIMDSFIVQNGLASRVATVPANNNSFIYGEGGGLNINLAGEQNSGVTVSLTNMAIRNNTARGADTTSPIDGNNFNSGGFGVGGGLFTTFVNNLNLDQISFDGNKAMGGNGKQLAGAALGGGLWVDTGNVTGRNLSFNNNQVIAGTTTGSNQPVENRFAEVLGGGVMVRSGGASTIARTTAVFTNITIVANSAIGSSTASTGSDSIGGDASGAGFCTEFANVTIRDSQISNNTAAAGSGFTGGQANAGGIRTFNALFTLERSLVANNLAASGAANVSSKDTRHGPLSGGGLLLSTFDPNVPRDVTIRNSVIANNSLQFPAGGFDEQAFAGGGGAGIWLQGVDAVIEQTTIADNVMDSRLFFGQAIMLIAAGTPNGTTATIRNSVIANHRSGTDLSPTVSVFPGTTIRYQNVFFSNNRLNDGSARPDQGTYAEQVTTTVPDAGFTSPGTPNLDYTLKADSPLRNKAVNSAVEVDLFNKNRVMLDGPMKDVGAIEFGSSGTLGRTGAPALPPPVTTPPITPPVVPPGTTAPFRTFFGAGAGAGGSSTVRILNGDGSVRYSVDAFPGFGGGVRTATGDFNKDGFADIVVGTGPGSAQLKVISGKDQSTLFTLDAFPGFSGGLYVAAGDVNGDGFDDFAVTPDQGGGPRIRIFSGNGFTQIADFFGIDDPNFRGGARATFSDLNGDGRSDLLVAAGFGGGPRIAGFNATSLGGDRVKLFADFFIFEEALRNGAFIGGGDINGDGFGDIIGGGGPGGGPRVLGLSGADITSGTRTQLTNFFAGDPNNRGGVTVAGANLDGDNRIDIVTGPGETGGSAVSAYTGSSLGGTPAVLRGFDPFPGFGNGVFVG